MDPWGADCCSDSRSILTHLRMGHEEERVVGGMESPL